MANLPRRRFISLVPLVATSLVAVATASAADEEVSDDLLFDRVNRRLIVDPQLGIRPLTVNVQDGKVTVTGFVETEKLRKRVDKIVKKAKGVREVDNQVQIRQ